MRPQYISPDRYESNEQIYYVKYFKTNMSSLSVPGNLSTFPRKRSLLSVVLISDLGFRTFFLGPDVLNN